MIALTVHQRDLVRHLLLSDAPLSRAQLGEAMHLTPHQVSYRLESVTAWLAAHGVSLVATPGSGIRVECSAERRVSLLRDIDRSSNLGLVLTAGEREQLAALKLLVATEPVLLRTIQRLVQTSRTTALKDVDAIEQWLQSHRLSLIRRPNYGFLVHGTELSRRQALASLLWGDTPFPDPLFAMTYHQGLVFSLSGAAASVPIVHDAIKLLSLWDTQAALVWIARAEDELGGRYADEAVLCLALLIAVQKQRVDAGYRCEELAGGLPALEDSPAWSVARDLARDIWPAIPAEQIRTEIAALAMILLSGTWSDHGPAMLVAPPEWIELIDRLVDSVARAFADPGLAGDVALREGLQAQVISVLLRQRFNIWSPPSSTDSTIARQFGREYAIAEVLAEDIAEHTGIRLPTHVVDTLAVLVRAAYVRRGSGRPWRVLVVCPTGMATSQLLAARLKARFPQLEILGTISLRELSSEGAKRAHLLITTTPLPALTANMSVIQVHPLLLPEDVMAIARWVTPNG